MRRRGNVRPAGRTCALRRSKPVEADSYDELMSSGGRHAARFRPQSAGSLNAAADRETSHAAGALL
jgi:hypothetical protein